MAGFYDYDNSALISNLEVKMAQAKKLALGESMCHILCDDL